MVYPPAILYQRSKLNLISLFLNSVTEISTITYSPLVNTNFSPIWHKIHIPRNHHRIIRSCPMKIWQIIDTCTWKHFCITFIQHTIPARSITIFLMELLSVDKLLSPHALCNIWCLQWSTNIGFHRMCFIYGNYRTPYEILQEMLL